MAYTKYQRWQKDNPGKTAYDAFIDGALTEDEYNKQVALDEKTTVAPKQVVTGANMPAQTLNDFADKQFVPAQPLNLPPPPAVNWNDTIQKKAEPTITPVKPIIRNITAQDRNGMVYLYNKKTGNSTKMLQFAAARMTRRNPEMYEIR